MALLFIQHNLYYSVEILHADGRCFSRIFTGAPQKAREAALTFFLENRLDDAAREDTYILVSVHHLKTGEKVTVTSTALLNEPHEGLQQELELWEREGIRSNKVLYNFRQPQHITFLPSVSKELRLCDEQTIMGLADDWVITFGRKKTALSQAI